MKWISVEDSLPQEDETVVAKLSKEKEPICVRYIRTPNRWSEEVRTGEYQFEDQYITHWMPIPSFEEKK